MPVADISGGAEYRVRQDFRSWVEAARKRGAKTLPAATLQNIGGADPAKRRQAWLDVGLLRAGDYGFTGQAWRVWDDTAPPERSAWEKGFDAIGGAIDSAQDAVNSIPGVKAAADWLGDRADDAGISKAIRQDLFVSLPAGFFTGGLAGIAGAELVQADGDPGKAAVGTLGAVGVGVGSAAAVGAAAAIAAGAGAVAATGGGIAGASKIGSDALRERVTGEAALPEVPKQKAPPSTADAPPPSTTTRTSTSTVPGATSTPAIHPIVAELRRRGVGGTPVPTFWEWLAGLLFGGAR